MDASNWRAKAEAVSSSSPVTRRSYGQRNDRLSPLSRRQGSFGSGKNESPFTHSHRKPLDEGAAGRAIQEGRRLYVGNLPYSATTQDVEKLLVDVQEGIEGLSMSVDPLTGRNPSYCFVDFRTSDYAQRVMRDYDGMEFMRRPLRVKPGVKSNLGPSRREPISPGTGSHDSNPLFQDRWSSPRSPDQANTAGDEGRRCYVGGLPRFRDQFETNKSLREIFAGFNVDLVGKLITPHESKQDLPGNHHYCFVDFPTKLEADRAIDAIDGKEAFNGAIIVRSTYGRSKKLQERQTLYVSGLPEFESAEATESAMRDLFKDYTVESVSKLMTAVVPKDDEGHRHFCFVVVKHADEADRAIKELDWQDHWGWKIRVKPGVQNKAPRTEYRGWGATRQL